MKTRITIPQDGSIEYLNSSANLFEIARVEARKRLLGDFDATIIMIRSVEAKHPLKTTHSLKANRWGQGSDYPGRHGSDSALQGPTLEDIENAGITSGLADVYTDELGGLRRARRSEQTEIERNDVYLESMLHDGTDEQRDSSPSIVEAQNRVDALYLQQSSPLPSEDLQPWRYSNDEPPIAA